MRGLPPDAPFDRALFLDLIPAAQRDQPLAPVRLLAATRVNYAALPGGAGMTAPENLRRLGRRIVAANPALQLDPDTRAFLEGRAPAGLAGLAQFAAYDARYK